MWLQAGNDKRMNAFCVRGPRLSVVESDREASSRMCPRETRVLRRLPERMQNGSVLLVFESKPGTGTHCVRESEFFERNLEI